MNPFLLTVRKECSTGEGTNNFAIIEKAKVRYFLNSACLAQITSYNRVVTGFVDYPLFRLTRKQGTTEFLVYDKQYFLSVDLNAVVLGFLFTLERG